jgi:hypothetical protein
VRSQLNAINRKQSGRCNFFNCFFLFISSCSIYTQYFFLASLLTYLFQYFSLAVRDLSNLVKPEDIITSEHLVTLLAVVPKYSQKDWLASYETLTSYVVSVFFFFFPGYVYPIPVTALTMLVGW